MIRLCRLFGFTFRQASDLLYASSTIRADAFYVLESLASMPSTKTFNTICSLVLHVTSRQFHISLPSHTPVLPSFHQRQISLIREMKGLRSLTLGFVEAGFAAFGKYRIYRFEMGPDNLVRRQEREMLSELRTIDHVRDFHVWFESYPGLGWRQHLDGWEMMCSLDIQSCLNRAPPRTPQYSTATLPIPI